MADPYKPVSSLIPSNQRSYTFTTVVEGDQIDVSAVLGRHARHMRITPDDPTDTISCVLNGKILIPHTTEGNFPGSVVVWKQEPVSTFTGGNSYETEEDFRISSIEFTNITYGMGGTSIEVSVW